MSQHLSPAELRELSSRYLMKRTRSWPDDPLALVSARGARVVDRNGDHYLDMFGGVATVVEYGNRRIATAQKAVIDDGAVHFSELYVNERECLAAQALANVMPAGLTRSRFTSSGSQANELAARIAMRKTGNVGLVALKHSYHGRTPTAAALTFQQAWRNAGPYGHPVCFAPNPYALRRPAGMDEELFFEWCLEQTEDTIRHGLGGRLAAIWIEPIQGNGGVVHGPLWYYGRLVELAHKYGGLVVADEVQTGIGRTGQWFASASWSSLPDIIVTAKALGNGTPVAAVTTTDEIAVCMDDFLDFDTFGGNPYACATVSATLDVVAEFLPNVRASGRELWDGLVSMATDRHQDVITEVRGEGLMIGVELVDPQDRRTPNASLMAKLHTEMRRRKVLIGKGGPFASVVRLKPPYCLTTRDVVLFLGALDEALTAVKTA